MSEKHLQQRLGSKGENGRRGPKEIYDRESGEVLEGSLVFVPKRMPSPFGEEWFAMAQDALMFLATRRKTLGEEGFAVFCAVAARLDFENWIAVSPTEVGKELRMARSNVSRAMGKLIGMGVISPGPTKGRVRTYQLNPAIGWKGTTKNHFTALQEARRKGWTVIDGDQDPKQPSLPLEVPQEP